MLPPLSSPSPEPAPEQHEPTPPPQARQHFDTVPDEMGFFRRYYYKPARDFDVEQSPDDFIDSPNLVLPSNSHSKSESRYTNPIRAFQNVVSDGLQAAVDWFAPLLNPTVFRLLHWAYTGSTTKSQAEVQRLVDNVLNAPDFDREHLRGFSMAREEARLNKALLSEASLVAQGWISDTVYILVPKENVSYPTMDHVPRVGIDGVLRRPLCGIWRGIWRDPALARQHNFNGFERWYRDPDTGEEERILGDIFTADAFLEEERKIRSRPRNPEDGPEVEYFCFPWGGYADKTHLANFGPAAMTPVYGWDLGLAKDVRAKMNNFTAHHIVYMPSVSPSGPHRQNTMLIYYCGLDA